MFRIKLNVDQASLIYLHSGNIQTQFELQLVKISLKSVIGVCNQFRWNNVLSSKATSTKYKQAEERERERKSDNER